MSPSWLIIPTVVLPTLLLLAWSVRLLLKARRSVDWPRVTATIVESRVVDGGKTRSPRLAFNYQVGAQPHVGRRLWVGPRSISASGKWADRVVSRYPMGAAVQVAADPADSAYAVLEPGLHALHWLPFAIATLMLASALFIAAAA